MEQSESTQTPKPESKNTLYRKLAPVVLVTAIIFTHPAMERVGKALGHSILDAMCQDDIPSLFTSQESPEIEHVDAERYHQFCTIMENFYDIGFISFFDARNHILHVQQSPDDQRPSRIDQTIHSVLSEHVVATMPTMYESSVENDMIKKFPQFRSVGSENRSITIEDYEKFYSLATSVKNELSTYTKELNFSLEDSVVADYTDRFIRQEYHIFVYNLNLKGLPPPSLPVTYLLEHERQTIIDRGKEFFATAHTYIHTSQPPQETDPVHQYRSEIFERMRADDPSRDPNTMVSDYVRWYYSFEQNPTDSLQKLLAFIETVDPDNTIPLASVYYLKEEVFTSPNETLFSENWKEITRTKLQLATTWRRHADQLGVEPTVSNNIISYAYKRLDYDNLEEIPHGLSEPWYIKGLIEFQQRYPGVHWSVAESALQNSMETPDDMNRMFTDFDNMVSPILTEGFSPHQAVILLREAQKFSDVVSVSEIIPLFQSNPNALTDANFGTLATLLQGSTSTTLLRSFTLYADITSVKETEDISNTISIDQIVLQVEIMTRLAQIPGARFTRTGGLIIPGKNFEYGVTKKLQTGIHDPAEISTPTDVNMQLLVSFFRASQIASIDGTISPQTGLSRTYFTNLDQETWEQYARLSHVMIQNATTGMWDIQLLAHVAPQPQSFLSLIDHSKIVFTTQPVIINGKRNPHYNIMNRESNYGVLVSNGTISGIIIYPLFGDVNETDVSPEDSILLPFGRSSSIPLTFDGFAPITAETWGIKYDISGTLGN